MLEELTSINMSDAQLSTLLLPLYCVECIKAVMKNERAVEMFIQHSEYIEKLAHSKNSLSGFLVLFSNESSSLGLSSPKIVVRSNVVQLLAAITYASSEGHKATVEALKKCQVSFPFRPILCRLTRLCFV